MKKASKYALAFAACFGIFILWVLFQTFVAKGVVVGVIFCAAMAGTWKAIVNSGGDKEEETLESTGDGHEEESAETEEKENHHEN